VDYWRIRLSLFLNFFLFAILLNTVGIVIAQTIVDYQVTRVQAGALEACKDLSIMLVSLLVASYVPRFGYRRSMLAALLAVTLASMLIAGVTGFWVAPVLYVIVGSSFALMKVSVYSTVGLITRDQKGHTSLMNLLEGIFQVGSLTGPLLFSAMIFWSHWNNTYWLIAILSAVALVLMLTTPLDESDARSGAAQAGLRQMLGLLRVPMVWVFVVCAWLYVMIEQSFGTWLPTFNREIFGASQARSAALLSLFAGSIAASRFLAGVLVRRVSWLVLQVIYLVAAFALTLTVVLVTRGGSAGDGASWLGTPALAYVFSLVGFFLGPIYPTISSIVLSRLEKSRHSAMTGLIIIFSALGGTTGSLLLGFFSQRYSTHDAFYFPLVPITLLALILLPYKRLSDRFGREHGTA
jgi:MFS transporter, FHS family, glucose/mannose:H+ symporter